MNSTLNDGFDFPERNFSTNLHPSLNSTTAASRCLLLNQSENTQVLLNTKNKIACPINRFRVCSFHEYLKPRLVMSTYPDNSFLAHQMFFEGNEEVPIQKGFQGGSTSSLLQFSSTICNQQKNIAGVSASSSLRQLPTSQMLNGHSIGRWTEEEFLVDENQSDENCSLNSSTSHQAMIKPKYSLNLHPGDSPTSGRSVMSNNKSVSKPLSLLARTPNHSIDTTTVARANDHQSSADSAQPAISKRKRHELWSAITPSFHQSFDDRAIFAEGFSNSCTHLDRSLEFKNYMTTKTGTGRRAAFCIGNTSKNAHGNTSAVNGCDSPVSLIYCSEPGCTGHSTCAVGAMPIDEIRKNQRLFKSPQSSFDSNTDVGQISMNWMRMNGVVQPFKHILQPASLATTPIPTHRQIHSPTVPAAVAATAATAAAIITSSSTAEKLCSSTTALSNVGPDTGGLERASTPIGNSNHSAFISQSSNQHARGFKGATTSEHEKGETTTADIIIIEPSSISLKPSGWVTTDSDQHYSEKTRGKQRSHSKTEKENSSLTSTAKEVSTDEKKSPTAQLESFSISADYCPTVNSKNGSSQRTNSDKNSTEYILKHPFASQKTTTTVCIKSPTLDNNDDTLCPEYFPRNEDEEILPFGTPHSARSSISSAGSAYVGGLINSPFHCSPNPSPPTLIGSHKNSPVSTSTEFIHSDGCYRRIGPGSVSLSCRMMSTLLKQQNSIAEEGEDGDNQVEIRTPKDSEIEKENISRTIAFNKIQPQHSHVNSKSSNCLLSPPEIPPGGNISPPPQRISPIPRDIKDEVRIVKAQIENSDSQQSNSKRNVYHAVVVNDQQQNRKGSLSPNNSLRYSATMLAAAKRNQFQQQRTVSEATPIPPALRDQAVAEIMGKGICGCQNRYSAGCVTTLGGMRHCDYERCYEIHHQRALRFEIGGDGSSSASSLNNGTSVNTGSNMSSMHSLNRSDSSRRRRRLGTFGGTDQYVSDGGSLPRMVALVHNQAFPPPSSMLSSAERKRVKGGGGSGTGSQVNLEKIIDPKVHSQQNEQSRTIRSKTPQPQKTTSQVWSSKEKPDKKKDSLQSIEFAQSTLTPAVNLSSVKTESCRECPSRWFFSTNKQRSCSESAFGLMQQAAEASLCTCCGPHYSDLPTNGQLDNDDGGQGTFPRATIANRNGTCLARKTSFSGEFPPSATAMKRRCSMTFINPDRDQVILQRILGPSGLGWLNKKHQRADADHLPKKSTSLLFSGCDDIEAQKLVNNIGSGGSQCPGGSVILGDETGSVKQPLMKEETQDRGGRLIKRQHLFNARRITCDYAFAFSLIGIALMITENELSYVNAWKTSLVLQWLIVFSTLTLVSLVIKFHVHEIQIFMNANSAEDWKIALTARRCLQIFTEIIICGICPLPVDNLDVFVNYVNSEGQNIPMKMSMNTFFSIVMFFRFYWLCRVLLLHSRLFTDAASRSIAGLNRVKTDSRFILKTMCQTNIGQMLMIFTASLWIIGGYILRLCERQQLNQSDDLIYNEKHQSYFNSLWLIAVTFLSIGYGDIVPNTSCGRIMAVVTGILGTCTSSFVVAVIARKLELTRAEKHVHNFMTETKHTKDLKHIAANVLRETWLIYKHRRLVDKIEPSKIRYHQRKFLVAICALRKLKTSQRKLDENRISLGDVAKTTSSSHELVREVHSTQEGLALRLTSVEHQLSDIQREIGSVNDLLRFLIRPYDYTYLQQQQQPQQHQFQHSTLLAHQNPFESSKKKNLNEDQNQTLEVQ